MRLFIVIAPLALFVLGCGNSEGLYPLFEVGQEYEFKTTDSYSFYAKGIVLDQNKHWVKVDLRKNPSNGWANVLWIRKDGLKWIGEIEERELASSNKR